MIGNNAIRGRSQTISPTADRSQITGEHTHSQLFIDRYIHSGGVTITFWNLLTGCRGQRESNLLSIRLFSFHTPTVHNIVFLPSRAIFFFSFVTNHDIIIIVKRINIMIIIRSFWRTCIIIHPRAHILYYIIHMHNMYVYKYALYTSGGHCFVNFFRSNEIAGACSDFRVIIII